MDKERVIRGKERKRVHVGAVTIMSERVCIMGDLLAYCARREEGRGGEWVCYRRAVSLVSRRRKAVFHCCNSKDFMQNVQKCYTNTVYMSIYLALLMCCVVFCCLVLCCTGWYALHMHPPCIIHHTSYRSAILQKQRHRAAPAEGGRMGGTPRYL